MLKVKLNDFKYRYDVYHMFKLFVGFDTIDFVEDNFDYSVDILDNEVKISTSTGEVDILKLDSTLKKNDGVKAIIFEYLRNKTGKKLPWGILIGIRPTKIVLEMMKEGYTEEEIFKAFKTKRYIREDKARLCIDIANIEKERVNKDQDKISVYVGMPFCPTRCLYCSFTSNPVKSCSKIIDQYLETLIYEMEKIRQFIDEKKLNIECVYFGGGTPTSVNDDQFSMIMKYIYEKFVVGRNIKEFNVECGRPDSINKNKLLTMKNYNVDRISINPQTMNNDTLKSIGRNHSVSDVIDKFKLARELGFNNINMDVIVGLPNEGLQHVKNTCEEILKLNPDSVTVHGMSVKRASKLHESIVNGKIDIKEQDELNQMYEETVKLSEKLNMKPYYMYRQKNMMGNMENVGYCSEGKEGIYNIQMIEERQTIIGIGADAVTKAISLKENRIERFPNIKDVREYILRIDEKINKKLDVLEELY